MKQEVLDIPWVLVEDSCQLFGVSYSTAKNMISAGTYPVQTYKVGRKPVCDKKVIDEFFRKKREEGLLALNTTKS